METEQTATETYPEADKSSAHSPTLFL